ERKVPECRARRRDICGQIDRLPVLCTTGQCVGLYKPQYPSVPSTHTTADSGTAASESGQNGWPDNGFPYYASVHKHSIPGVHRK
ncbi:unnamed protein product, partial [Oppiella nova]